MSFDLLWCKGGRRRREISAADGALRGNDSIEGWHAWVSARRSLKGRKMIRILASVFSVIGAVGMAAPASAQTAISQYPFCIQGEDNPGWSGCSFNTLASCQAAASGTFAECLTNPWYRAGTTAAPDPGDNQIGADSPLPVGPPPN
jgi:Protein of unknown function (DUF3551)